MHAMRKPLTLLPAALAVLALALTACSGDDSSTAVDEGSAPESTTSCDYPVDPAGAAKEVEPPPAEAPDTGDVDVTIGTTVGDLRATLGRETDPVHGQLVRLAGRAGLLRRRGLPPDDDRRHLRAPVRRPDAAPARGGPGYSFADELAGTETYGRGTLAMANAGPDTNGSQFFIVYGDSPLPAAYNVFGTVDDDAVAAIEKVAQKGTDDANGQGDGHPKKDVTITSVTVG